MFGFKFPIKPIAVQKTSLAIKKTGAKRLPAIILSFFRSCTEKMILSRLKGLEISPKNKHHMLSKAQLSLLLEGLFTSRGLDRRMLT